MKKQKYPIKEILNKIIDLNKSIHFFTIQKYNHNQKRFGKFVELRPDNKINLEYSLLLAKTESIENIEILIDSELFLFALCSRVFDEQGQILYIPIVDFLLPVSDKNSMLLTEKLLEIFAFEGYIGGWLLQTANSYHFIGKKIMSYGDWVKFMSRMLLLRNRNDSFIVDDRYIGYSLYRSDSVCRFTEKDGNIPFVVAEI